MVPLAESKSPEPPSAEARAAELKAKALQSLGALPPFSPVVTRLLATLAREDVSFSLLGDLIEKDTVVAANILHLVNSALYARRGQINSVRHAISLLGMNKLRNAVLGMSIARVWNKVRMPANWSMARFNMHSAAVGVLADLLAQRVPVEYPEGAFVAGLLHDVGRLLIALGLPEQFAQILEVRNSTGAGTIVCEREILGFTHPELSADALRVWQLPEPICNAVRDHHLGVEEMSLARILDAANQYANSAGVTILPNDRADSADGAKIESLGLDAGGLEALLAEFGEEHNAMAVYFR